MRNLRVEEMNIYGVTELGSMLSPDDIEYFKNDLLEKKKADIERYGTETLIQNGDLEVVRDLSIYGDRYLKLLEQPALNEFVDQVLNDKAVVHSYNGVITRPDIKSIMLGYRFHRDQPFFKDTRTSINVMIPLVDYSSANGSTEYVPSSHLFKEIPSEDFLEKHKVSTNGKAGHGFAIDATTWHRAGKNASQTHRPMIVIKYTLAPFKQQIDFCESAKAHLESASALVRQRLGWNVRMCASYHEFREPNATRKFKSGQYDMSNTDLHR